MPQQLQFQTEPCREIVTCAESLSMFCDELEAHGARVEGFSPVQGKGWEITVYWPHGKPQFTPGQQSSSAENYPEAMEF